MELRVLPRSDHIFIASESRACRAAFGYFYFEDEPGRRSVANLLTKDEARRMGLELRQAAGAAAQAIDR